MRCLLSTTRWLVIVLLLVLGSVLAPGQKAMAQQTPPPACTESYHRAFDFWIGEWVVTNPDGVEVGRNTIELTEGGCLLVENWTSARGGTGKSMNYWDPAEKRWKQVWVSINGSVGHFEGNLLEEGVMVLEGDMLSAQGDAFLLKGTWTLLDDQRVRQHFEQSTDEGKTWSTWFDGYYAKAGSSSE
ncbi:MAG: hypothetical protein KTR29_22490 [Rhodothermaceae bacterium]|nr:hypothetical protein [Rhodothermaceae bacterium]